MAFPTTSLLDDFNRTNEDPLTGGGTWNGPWYPSLSRSRLISNQLPDEGLLYSSFWVASFGPDTEIFYKVVDIGTRYDLVLRSANENTASVLGYDLSISAGVWTFYRFDSAVSFVTLGSTISQTVSNGDSVGFSAIGSTLEAWYKAGAGAWTSLGTRTDSTITGAGHIAINHQATLDDFGGGTVVGGAVTPKRLMTLGIGSIVPVAPIIAPLEWLRARKNKIRRICDKLAA